MNSASKLDSLSPCKKWRFEKLDSALFPLAKQFYKAANYHSQIGRKDEVFVVRDSYTNTIVAACRLVKVADYLILRSMVVDPSIQRQGIGHFFLEQLSPFLSQRQCWCFPFEWLESFYSRGGFCLQNTEESPKLIQQKFHQYHDQGRKILIMSYP